MLITKGFRVSFVLTSGKTIRPPASYALMHDEDGADWPYCSGLVAPLKTTSKQPVRSEKAALYFGYEPYRGTALIPSGDDRRLSSWKKVGDVAEILYTRRRSGGAPASHKGDYYHSIRQKKPGILAAVLRLGLPAGATLYRQGRLYRIELARGCVWNWRGIVSP
jgi:hypothetical protein